MTNNDDDQSQEGGGARRKPRVLIDLPADLKEALDRSAFANARPRNSEIVLRLRQSFEGDARLGRSGSALDALERGPAIAGWLAGSAQESSNEEQKLLSLFRQLTESQRAALLQLLQQLS